MELKYLCGVVVLVCLVPGVQLTAQQVSLDQRLEELQKEQTKTSERLRHLAEETSSLKHELRLKELEIVNMKSEFLQMKTEYHNRSLTLDKMGSDLKHCLAQNKNLSSAVQNLNNALTTYDLSFEKKMAELQKKVSDNMNRTDVTDCLLATSNMSSALGNLQTDVNSLQSGMINASVVDTLRTTIGENKADLDKQIQTNKASLEREFGENKNQTSAMMTKMEKQMLEHVAALEKEIGENSNKTDIRMTKINKTIDSKNAILEQEIDTLKATLEKEVGRNMNDTDMKMASLEKKTANMTAKIENLEREFYIYKVTLPTLKKEIGEMYKNTTMKMDLMKNGIDAQITNLEKEIGENRNRTTLAMTSLENMIDGNITNLEKVIGKNKNETALQMAALENNIGANLTNLEKEIDTDRVNLQTKLNDNKKTFEKEISEMYINTTMKMDTMKNGIDAQITNLGKEIGENRNRTTLAMTSLENMIDGNITNLEKEIRKNKNETALQITAFKNIMNANITNLEKEIDANKVNLQTKSTSLENMIGGNITNVEKEVAEAKATLERNITGNMGILETKIAENTNFTARRLSSLENKLDANITNLAKEINENKAAAEKQIHENKAVLEKDIHGNRTVLEKEIHENRNQSQHELATLETTLRTLADNFTANTASHRTEHALLQHALGDLRKEQEKVSERLRNLALESGALKHELRLSEAEMTKLKADSAHSAQQSQSLMFMFENFKNETITNASIAENKMAELKFECLQQSHNLSTTVDHLEAGMTLLQNQCANTSVFTTLVKTFEKEIAENKNRTLDLLALTNQTATLTDIHQSQNELSLLNATLQGLLNNITDWKATHDNVSYEIECKDMSQGKAFHHNDVIIFPNPVYNNGNGYDSYTGRFIAPKTGEYLFWGVFTGVLSFSIGGAHGEERVRINMMYERNGSPEIIAQGNELLEHDYDSLTLDKLITLRTGDEVYFQNADNVGDVILSCAGVSRYGGIFLG